MGWYVMSDCVSLVFFKLQKRKISDKKRVKGYLCQAWRHVREVLWSFVIKRDGGGWWLRIGKIYRELAFEQPHKVLYIFVVKSL